VTAFRLGIAGQLSEIDWDHCGQSTGKDGKEEGIKARIKKLSDQNAEQEEGQSYCSVEEEEDSETEEERDTHLDKEESDERWAVMRMQAG